MPPQPRPGVVGRTSERLALQALLERTASGAGGAAVLDGEAGIGKTTLLDDLAEASQHRGMRVLRGAARELESDLAFGAIADALGLGSARGGRPRQEELARLISLLRGSGEAERDVRFLVLDELADVVELWCASAPVLCVIDDVHWADPSTTLALSRLARLVGWLPLVLVVALRPVPRPPHVRLALDALRAAGADTLRLEPLGPAEVSELARVVLGRSPGPSDQLRLEATGGNPLFVVELLRAAEQDEISVEDAAAALPPSLRLTLLGRVSPLPAEAVEALRLASLLGSTFTVAHLALLLGCSETEAARALRPAFDAGLLHDAAHGAVRFRHDLVRDAVYEEMPGALRTSLHAQAGRVLATAGATPLELARHVSLGAVAGDPGAVEVLVQAAGQVRSTAPAVGVDLLEKALELTGPLGAREGAVHAELALALRTLGRSSEATRHAQAALASATLPRRTRFVLTQLICETMISSGRARELLAVTSTALRDPSVSAEERAVYALGDWLLRVMAGLDPDSEPAPGDVLAGAPVEDEELRAYRAYGSAVARFGRGDLPSALPLLGEALSAAERARTWREAAGIRMLRAVALAFVDQLAGSERDLRESRRIAEELGGQSATTLNGSLALFAAGRWDELSVELDVRRQHALDEGLEPTFGELAWRGFLAVRAGAPDAPQLVAAAEEALERQGPVFAVHLFLWSRALLAERRAGVKAAAALLREDVHSRRGDRFLVRLVGPEAVRLCVAAGDLEGARDMLALLEGVAQLWDAPSAHAAVRRSRALCERDPAGLLAAVALYRETPARTDELAATLRDAAVALARTEPARAEALAGEAAAIFRRLGAGDDAAQCERLLSAGEQQVRQRPVTGWGSLTSTERQVVELLARGLRNKQIAAELFVSPRTVETHVSHALAKLQVRTRVELAAHALAELQTA